ncbi:uncharacterized protein BT62DRAFT_691100 [Guyanagaster necrorhizus]|uniref:Uncharacterized protein n=1 Tax=Guyanagaster necrorhizus TaxID=856835 RepID=A0A9P7VFT1_9AGAR|nr:uncharacterized protein BT62DRAFT_691100 [Guyanagaster necrorhizus MCA 3950]KAG7439782.1 hypothetical protein BT62DRAFT_691100 [Guyanagaster necrorhizus MCA 3950]
MAADVTCSRGRCFQAKMYPDPGFSPFRRQCSGVVLSTFYIPSTVIVLGKFHSLPITCSRSPVLSQVPLSKCIPGCLSSSP